MKFSRLHIRWLASVLGMIVLMGLCACSVQSIAQEGGSKLLAEEPVEKQPELFREGRRLVNEKGTVVCLKCDLGVSTSHRRAFRMKSSKVLTLLENKKLEELESKTKHSEWPIRVSGEVTVYNRNNYLLLSSFRVIETDDE